MVENKCIDANEIKDIEALNNHLKNIFKEVCMYDTEDGYGSFESFNRFTLPKKTKAKNNKRKANQTKCLN